jgi:uncharacterized protein
MPHSCLHLRNLRESPRELDMLHSYAFSNFRSFRERTEVPLTLAENAPVNGWAMHSSAGPRVTTALAIIGPNGAGKTSLIQPLAFLQWFIPHSFSAPPDSPIWISQHFAAREDEPTTFEVIADADEPRTLWRYRLSATRKRVLAESVERKLGRGAWQMVFDRRWDGATYTVEQNEFGLDPTQATAVRPNVSFISWAAQYGVPLARELSSFLLHTNLTSIGRMPLPFDVIERSAEWYEKNPSMRDQMRQLLARWDLGLTDVVIHEYESADPSDPSGSTKQKRWFPFGVHRDKKNQYTLPFYEESSGTRSAFTLLVSVLAVLAGGGVLAYDELDSDLHPMMLPPLLDLFSNPDTNPNLAQILFTTHQVDVLRLLQKSQVVIVEKDELESHAWRLDELEGVRSDENRVARYLAGAYGGIPRF